MVCLPILLICWRSNPHLLLSYWIFNPQLLLPRPNNFIAGGSSSIFESESDSDSGSRSTWDEIHITFSAAAMESKLQRRPPNPTTILALPLYPYRANSNQINECVICLSEFEEEEAVKEIPFCKHAFHAYCLDMWLSVQKTCPLCRTSRLDANHDVCIYINEGVRRGPVIGQA